MSDLPTLPAKGNALFLSRRSFARLLQAIRRRTVKVASGLVDLEGPEGPVKLGLGLRAGADGRTIFLRDVAGGDDDGSSSSSSSSDSSDSSSSSDSSDSSPSSESEPSTPSESSDSSKTAIVRVGDKWVGWVCRESPEAKFEDVVEVAIGAPDLIGEAIAEVVLPAEFVESCEMETIRVLSVMPDMLAMATARIVVDLDAVVLQVRARRVPEIGEWPGVVICRIEGTRKGHAGRWVEYTEAQAEANARFYSLAHTPGAWL